MLSRAQEARVLEVLGDCSSGILRTYCLDHLAAAVKIPPTPAADLIAFLQAMRAKGGRCRPPGRSSACTPP
jgi:hypothetical protein